MSRSTLQSSPISAVDDKVIEGHVLPRHRPLSIWTATTLASLVTWLLIAPPPFLQRLLSRFAPVRRRVAATTRTSVKALRRRSLPALAEAIVGSDRAMIASVFGPPRAAVVEGVDAATISKTDTWYYTVPRQSHMAMAINFENELARRVVFFSGRAE